MKKGEKMPSEPKPQLNSWTLYSKLKGNEYSFHTFKSPSENCVTGKTATANKMGIFGLCFFRIEFRVTLLIISNDRSFS